MSDEVLFGIVLMGAVLFIGIYVINDRKVSGMWSLKNVILAILLIFLVVLFRSVLRGT